VREERGKEVKSLHARVLLQEEVKPLGALLKRALI
jgi:hypothetical protein